MANLLDAHVAEALPRPGWRRSDKGNLTRGSPAGYRLTVFRRGGWFAWAMARDGHVRYSRPSYRTEAEACQAVWAEANRELDDAT